METPQVTNDSMLFLILAGVAAILALAALVLAAVTFLKLRKMASKPSAASLEAMELAKQLDFEFEGRCRKEVKKVMEEERELQLKAARDAAEKAAAEKAAAEAAAAQAEKAKEPEPPVYVSEHFYGEYSEMDCGFMVEDLCQELTPRVQVEIDTITPETAEFSILSDLDPNLVPGIKICCELESGDWMSFRTIRTVVKGRLALKGDRWVVVDKAKLVLE